MKERASERERERERESERASERERERERGSERESEERESMWCTKMYMLIADALVSEGFVGRISENVFQAHVLRTCD